MTSELELRVLQIVDEQEPITDEALAHEIDDSWGEDDVSHITHDLETKGLLQSSQASPPPRWQITDEGRSALRDDSGA